ncbi:MAG: murein biosynthesis integral membrane protein MurJ [Alphaproteobacteria bacterium]
MTKHPPKHPQKHRRHLAKPIGEVSLWTAASRFLGFWRDVVLASILGASPVTEAFIIALRLPNLFRRVFAEGAFSYAFIPIYGRQLSHQQSHHAKNQTPAHNPAHDFATSAIAGLLFVMLLLLIIAWLTMPWIVNLLAPGFENNSNTQNLAILLARLTFPYLTLTAITAAFAAVCNAHGFFAAGAIAPLFFNFTLILALLIFKGEPNETIGIALASAVTISGILQATFMIWACKKLTNFHIPKKQWLKPQLTPEIKHLISSMTPIAMSVGVFQINFLIATAIVSLKEGGISHIYYAERIYQLPLALIGVAIAIVLLPDLAKKLGREHEAAARKDFNRAFQAAWLLVLPASAGLIVLSQPIVSVLFERGAFSHNDTQNTASVLAAFSLGLPAYVATRVIQPAFFAHDDTRSPLRAALWGVAVSIALMIPLFQILEATGVALATALGGWVTTILLYQQLGRKFGWWPDKTLIRHIAYGILASSLMAAALYGILQILPQWNAAMLNNTSEGRRVFALLATIATGVVLYGILLTPILRHRLPNFPKLPKSPKPRA